MPAIPLSPPKHENQRWDEGDLSEAPPFGTTPMSPTPSVTHSIPHHAGAPVPAARPELAAQEPRQLSEVMIFAFHTHLRAPLSAFPWKTHGKFTLTHNELPTEWAGQMSHRQQRGSGCQSGWKEGQGEEPAPLVVSLGAGPSLVRAQSRFRLVLGASLTPDFAASIH